MGGAQLLLSYLGCTHDWINGHADFALNSLLQINRETATFKLLTTETDNVIHLARIFCRETLDAGIYAAASWPTPTGINGPW